MAWPPTVQARRTQGACLGRALDLRHRADASVLRAHKVISEGTHQIMPPVDNSRNFAAIHPCSIIFTVQGEGGLCLPGNALLRLRNFFF